MGAASAIAVLSPTLRTGLYLGRRDLLGLSRPVARRACAAMTERRFRRWVVFDRKEMSARRPFGARGEPPCLHGFLPFSVCLLSWPARCNRLLRKIPSPCSPPHR